MDNGMHFGNSGRGVRLTRSKVLLGTLLVLALVLALCLGGAYGAYAQLKDTTGSVTENYSVPAVSCVVNDDYTVTNTGNIPVLVRVKAVPNAVNDQGQIVANAVLPALSYGEGWSEIGGCLYYQGYVAPGAKTTQILAAVPDGVKVVVLAEAIQANPAEAAAEAWGAEFNSGVWTAR